jgi:hypothetical protein
MISSAKLLKMGAILVNPVGSMRCRAGPRAMPNKISRRLSGIPFLLNRKLPMYPRQTMTPVRIKRRYVRAVASLKD